MTDFALRAPEGFAQIAYTPNRAAAALNISRGLLYREIAASRIIAKKVSRRKTLIPVSSLTDWLASLPNADSVDSAA